MRLNFALKFYVYIYLNLLFVQDYYFPDLISYKIRILIRTKYEIIYLLSIVM